jgi:hypothetical protein
MVNLSRLSDEEVLAGCKDSAPLFKTAEEKTEAYLTELKRRFCVARERKALFLGYSSWNKFVVGELAFSLTTVRRLTPTIKLQDHSYDWRPDAFGKDCYKRNEAIGKGLLESVASKFPEYQWGGWAPWHPTMDSDVKAGYKPVEDRYKVTLFLSASQIRSITRAKGAHDK